MAVFIIAEAGVNHNGSLDMALALVDEAARAGADAVKFQTFRADLLAAANAPKARYQQAVTGSDDGQLAMLRRLELSDDMHNALVQRCHERGIEFMSTAFDVVSLRLLVDQIGIRRLKVPSGEVTNGPLLAAFAATGLPVILSSGMCRMAEIADALALFATVWTTGAPPTGQLDTTDVLARPDCREALRERMTLLHCTTEYPAPLAEINLRAMDRMRAEFGLPVGYSDHSQGIVVPVAAAARDAVVIEKHFTLDRNLPGPDHKASLEPGELAQMVRDIRAVETALGTGNKEPTPSESLNIPIARRSLVAARLIAAGELFSSDALTAKRPAGGLSPMAYWSLLGRPARRAYDPDEPIDQEEA